MTSPVSGVSVKTVPDSGRTDGALAAYASWPAGFETNRNKYC